jgi:hypothetical protein
MRAGVACLLLGLAALLFSCGGEDVAPAVGTDSPTPMSTEAPTLSAASTPSPEPSPTAAISLPEPAEGFAWQHVPPTLEYGLPAYAAQVPTAWTTPQLWANPVAFAPSDDPHGLLKMVTRAMPVDLGFEHPLLEDLPMSGTTCADGKPIGRRPGVVPEISGPPPAAQFVGEAYTWDIYYFSCATRVTAASGQTPVPFEAQAAEVQIGEVIFSIVATEPPGTGATQAAFEQALRSFRQV